jgi:hypothetical protein
METTKMPEQFNRKDLQIILEVNKKAVEIETIAAEEREEIFEKLTAGKLQQDRIEDKTDKLVEQVDELSKDMFRIKVLYVSGLLALAAQIIEIYFKK